MKRSTLREILVYILGYNSEPVVKGKDQCSGSPCTKLFLLMVY
jgi:hypothetical protein